MAVIVRRNLILKPKTDGLITHEQMGCWYQYKDYPKDFARDWALKNTGIILSKDQEDFVQAVAHHPRVAMKAGTGQGKTLAFYILVTWFLATRVQPYIPITAPTKHQLKDALWTEIARWLQISPLRHLIRWEAEKIVLIPDPLTSYAVGRTAKEAQSLAGRHANHMLFLADEASIIRNEIFEAIEGCLTSGSENRFAMIGNPTQISGYFYDAFHSDSDDWYTMTINGEVSPRSKPEYVARMARKYGKDSDIYRVRVLGEFPRGNPDAFIQLADVEAAMLRDIDIIPGAPFEIGCDVARGGANKTCIATRQGNKGDFPLILMAKSTIPETVRKILETVRLRREECKYKGVVRVKIDDTGLGCVTDNTKILTEQGWKKPSEILVGDKIYSKNKAGIVTIETVIENTKREETEIIDVGGTEFSWSHLLPYKTRPKHPFILGDWKTVCSRRYPILDNIFNWVGEDVDFVIPANIGRMPYGGEKIYKVKRSIAASVFARFLGWYLSEGNLDKNAINISQSIKSPHNKEIEAVVKAVNNGICCKRVAKSGEITYKFNDKHLVSWIKENCYVGGTRHHASYKKIPAYIKGLTKETISNCFLDAFCKGDGYIHKGARQYGTTSKQMADDILELIYKSGKNGTIKTKALSGSHGYIHGRKITRQHDSLNVGEWKHNASVGISDKLERKTKIEPVYHIVITGETKLFFNTFKNGQTFWTHNGGVVDMLKEDRDNNLLIIPCLYGRVGAETSPEYTDKASEMWGELRDQIQYISLPNDGDLREELATRKVSYVGGRTKIQDKDSFKGEYGDSPDSADAVVLAFAKSVEKKRILSFSKYNKTHLRDFKINWRLFYKRNAQVFMSVWEDEDLVTSLLMCLWDGYDGHLYVFDEVIAKDPRPESTIPRVILKMNELTKDQLDARVPLQRFQWYCNKEMCGITGNTKSAWKNAKDGIDQLWGQEPYKICLTPNLNLDNHGAIAVLTSMFAKGLITVHTRCHESVRQLSEWAVERNGRPGEENVGIAMALANIVGLLHEWGHTRKFLTKLLPYSPASQAARERLERADKDGTLFEQAELLLVPGQRTVKL